MGFLKGYCSNLVLHLYKGGWGLTRHKFLKQWSKLEQESMIYPDLYSSIGAVCKNSVLHFPSCNKWHHFAWCSLPGKHPRLSNSRSLVCNTDFLLKVSQAQAEITLMTSSLWFFLQTLQRFLRIHREHYTTFFFSRFRSTAPRKYTGLYV